MRPTRRSARPAAALALLALAGGALTLPARAPVASRPAVAAVSGIAGRIAFAGTDHLGLGRVTGTTGTAPLFGPGPQHFDQDPSALGSLLVFTSLRDSAQPQVYLREASGAVRRLTTGMDAAHPRLTPDGRDVVFDAAEPGGTGGGTQRDLWLVGTDGTGLRRLTDTPADETSPTVSPDGRTLAYSSTADPRHAQLYVRPLAGGTPVRITDVAVGDAVEPVWNPVDDAAHRDLIAYTWDQGGDTGPRLRITTPDGADRPLFTDTQAGWRTSAAAWLPGGDDVLFLSPDTSGGAPTSYPRLYRTQLPSCETQLVLDDPRTVGPPTWLGDPVSGGPVVGQTSAGSPGTADLEDVRPDGSDPRDLGVSILTEDPAADTNTDPDKDPLFEPAAGYDPWTERQTYTPDGQRIVVTRFEGPADDRIERLWEVNADGSDPHPLDLPGRGTHEWDTDPVVSPDGSLVAFTMTDPGRATTDPDHGRVVVADLADGAVVGTVQPPADQPDASDAQPAWAPDGRHLAFTRTETVDGRGGSKHIWTAAFPGLGAQTDVSTTVCPGDCAVVDDSPAYSPAGGDLAFNREVADAPGTGRTGVLVVSGDGGCRVVLPLGLTGSDACRRELPDSSADGPFQPRDVAWSSDGSQLVFTARRAQALDSPEELEVYDVARATLTPLDSGLPGRQKEPDVQPSTDLSLSAPPTTPPVRPGSRTTVVVTVTNHGPLPSPNTVLTVSVPTGVRLSGLTTATGTCDAASLQCRLGLLPPGRSVPVTATVTGTTIGDHQLVWTVCGDLPDPTGDNTGPTVVPVVATLPTPPPSSPPPTSPPPSSPPPTSPPSTSPSPSIGVPPPPASGPALSLTAQPDPGYVDGRVTLTYTVRDGPGTPATGLELTLGLPPKVPTEPLPAGCAAGVCELADVSPGATAAVQVVLKPRAALRTTVTGSLTTTGTDPDTGDNTATTPVRVLQPRIVAVPPIGKPGFVTSVRGTDFPPGVPVRFSWNPGITAAAAPTVPDGHGAFAGQLLILAKDQTGPRTITARGPGFSPVTCDFLVVSGSSGPPDEVERR
ncbi:hypothetical protein POF50_016700 [Streptomyces sp. SL13]|uniref:DUF11 domain-containing protein n=1 Tax=Streptantibioticus silvisoli TaxID=2705255 RepID=A0AA90K9J6_9ACTN|nr:hypothetical protein [Streptantibioticus silvisoli]MDI5970962.1 hypothetical protein [Streptantibioticus silvisoli]